MEHQVISASVHGATQQGGTRTAAPTPEAPPKNLRYRSLNAMPSLYIPGHEAVNGTV